MIFSHIGSYARSEDCLISDGPPLLEDRLRFLPQIGGLSASDRLPPKISKIGLIMRFLDQTGRYGFELKKNQLAI